MRDDHVALTKCFFCLEDGCILLATRYRQDGSPLHSLKPYHGKVVDMTPCSKCAEYMKQGIILITIDPAKSEPGWEKPAPIYHKANPWSQQEEYPGIPNPYRAGGFIVVTEDAIRRWLANQKDLLDWCLKHRWMFIEHEAAIQAGMIEAPKINMPTHIPKLKER